MAQIAAETFTSLCLNPSRSSTYKKEKKFCSLVDMWQCWVLVPWALNGE